MIHAYKLNGYNIILDINSGCVHLVDEVAFDIISDYETKDKETIKAEILKKYSNREDVTPEDINAVFDDIEELKTQGKLFTEDKFRAMAPAFKKRQSVIKAMCLHVAHDCNVGNNCILVSYVGIAGETDVDDWATIGGSSVAHQFSRVGKHAFVGGACKINKDVPPYVLCGRDPLTYAGVNLVGLRRRGFSSDQIRNIKDMYDVIYNSGMNVSDALARIESGFPQSEERDTILEFIKASKRGIIKGPNSDVKGSIE